MRKFLLTLTVECNGQKVSAIRDLRGATGMGLAVTKEFVETLYEHGTSSDGWRDKYGGELIANAEQVANLTVLHLKRGEAGPLFTIERLAEISPPSAIDISELKRYN